MMHVNDGRLKAYLDEELTPAESRQVQDHLAHCPACQTRAALVAERAAQAHSLLTTLASDRVPTPPGLARARLTARLNQVETKERETMFAKLFSGRMRPAWAALAVIALLVVVLTVPSVQAIANSFLGLFRVEQVNVIQIDPGMLEDSLASSQQFERLLTENVNLTGGGERIPVADAAEASARTGAPVRLPTSLGAADELTVQPGGVAEFNIDLALVQAFLGEVGQTDVDLPAELDGQTVTVHIPDAVGAQYGDCPEPEQFDPDSPEARRSLAAQMADCVSVLQMRSPEIEAPEGLDINALGQAYLQVLGMTPDEAARYAATVDWTTTLVVPVPQGKADVQTVSVDGVQGTFLQQAYGPEPHGYVLVWVKDGLLYGIQGSGSLADALQIASSLQ